VEYQLNAATGAAERSTVVQPDIRGDLLLLRNDTRQLIDVTVARHTSLTELKHGTATSGPHMQPLVAARIAVRQCRRRGPGHCRAAPAGPPPQSAD